MIQLKKETVLSYAFGKVQPQTIPLEEAVLGALMLDRNALGLVDNIITPESFYLESHQHIYRAITSLAEASHPVDLLTVTESLKKDGLLEKIGGGYYLIELSNRVASAANIEYHARIIKQKQIQRQLIDIGTRATIAGYDDTQDVFEQLEKVESEIYGLGQNSFSKPSFSIGQLSIEALNAADAAMSKKGLTGVPCGLNSIDSQTGGFQPSDLIILAARPGMGKTALAISIALNASEMYEAPTLFFSLEMSSVQIAQRVVAQRAGINVQAMRTGKIDGDGLRRMGESVENMQVVKMYVDDTPAITLSAFRSKSRKAVAKQGVKMILVDYLQLMDGRSGDKGGNREQEIGTISRGLKALAKELNVPVIALSQLSRKVEDRGGSKRPMLSDLRESGSIEQDSDAVIFLYRPEYYGITEDEQGQSTKAVCEAIFAKHRNGACGAVVVGFKDESASFFNIDEPQISAQPSRGELVDFSTARPNIRNDEDTPF